MPFSRLPVPEIEIVMDEIRRIGGRMRPPIPLRFVDAQDQCHCVRLEAVCHRNKAVVIKRCEVIDVSMNGIAFACAAIYEPGEKILLRAADLESGDTLFSEALEIKNSRKNGAVDESGRKLYVHGACSKAKGHSHLYKAILDSVFVDHLTRSNGETVQRLPWSAED